MAPAEFILLQASSRDICFDVTATSLLDVDHEPRTESCVTLVPVLAVAGQPSWR
jgi:hypothetical protein